MPCPCDQAVTSDGRCPLDTSADAVDGASACPIGKCRHIFSDACPNSQITMDSVINALSNMLQTTEVVEQDRERLSQPGNTESVAQRDLNDRLVLAERALCTREGLRDRPWFKHLVMLSLTQLFGCGWRIDTPCLCRCTLPASSTTMEQINSQLLLTHSATRSWMKSAFLTGHMCVLRSLGLRRQFARLPTLCATPRCRFDPHREYGFNTAYLSPHTAQLPAQVFSSAT